MTHKRKVQTSTKVWDFFWGHFDQLWKIAMVVGVLGIYFLGTKFITIERYDKDRLADVQAAEKAEAVERAAREKESERRDASANQIRSQIDKVAGALEILALQAQVNARQDDSLKDHEARIRVLEQKR